MRSVLTHDGCPPLCAAVLLGASLVGCGPGRPPLVDVAALADTSDTVGPYTVTVLIRDDGSIKVAQVRYFTGPGAAPRPLDLARDGSTDRWSAGIPGQPPGTHVRYVVEVEDDEGNLVTLPSAVDANERLPAYAFTVVQP
jgi:hypothetical protein